MFLFSPAVYLFLSLPIASFPFFLHFAFRISFFLYLSSQLLRYYRFAKLITLLLFLPITYTLFSAPPFYLIFPFLFSLSIYRLTAHFLYLSRHCPLSFYLSFSLHILSNYLYTFAKNVMMTSLTFLNPLLTFFFTLR